MVGFVEVPTGSVVGQRRIFEHLIFMLDGVSLLHHHLSGLPANIRLRSQPAAIVVPGFTRQFAGQSAEFLDGRHEVVTRVWVVRGTMTILWPHH